MNKIKWLGAILASIVFSSAGLVMAANLALTKIGVLSTVGIDYSTVDYVGGIPTFEGTATPGAQVAIKIKTTISYVMTASPSGVWQFVPTSLDTGSNPIVITSGEQSLAFILNFNATPSATPTATPTAVVVPAELPSAGVWEYYLLVVGAGLLVLLLGKYVRDKMHKWEGKK
jgi:hypothetical protein